MTGKNVTLFVNVSQSDKKYWIKLHKNNQYIPYGGMNAKKEHTCTVRHPKPPSDHDGWQLVKSSRKTLKFRECTEKDINNQPIYYWVVDEHNLFDLTDESFKLFFTEPDTTQIENNDQNNYMAIDSNKQLRLIHIHLKHKGMKMTPTYYIAKNVQQIEDALKFVKYCVVKTENNEQKLVELE
jgi:hypothetical protein